MLTFADAAAILITDDGDEYVDQGGGCGFMATHKHRAPLPEGWRIAESVNDRQEILRAPDGTYWYRCWESSITYGWSDCYIQGPLEGYQEEESASVTVSSDCQGRW